MGKLPEKLRKVFKGLQVPLTLCPEILLCPNVPKPMHGVAPRVVLGSKWWNATRQAAYKSTLWRCLACGVHKSQAICKKWMEGHELYDVDYEKGTMTYIETVPLCHYCHNYIHDGRLHALLEKQGITQKKFTAIIQHGDGVLFRSGLKRKTRRERDDEEINRVMNNKMCEWGKWRLIVFGKEYKPKFKTPQQWRLVFQ